MRELAIGSVFAGHRVDGLAGRGGMGVVYEVTHLALGQRRALKVLAPELAEDEDFRKRFREEWKIAASIDHPRVIPIYDAGEQAGVLYITMRFVPGTDLGELVDTHGELEVERAIRIVGDVASALDAAHERGLVHRDVKPANILLENEQRVYLTDFGLTKNLASSAGLTRTGTFVGTVEFAAPEQISGGRVDARTDVYALGGVLCQALTATVPFPGDSDVAKMMAIMSQPRPVLSERRSDLPRELDGVIARAMAINPIYRYPSAGDLARAARAAVEERDVSVPERAVGQGAAAVSDLSKLPPPFMPTSPQSPPPSMPTSPQTPPPPMPTPPQTPPPSAPPPRQRPPAPAPIPTGPGPVGAPGRAAPQRRRRLALLGGGVLAALVVVVVALLALGGGSSSKTLTPPGAPFTFSYPASFKTQGLDISNLITGSAAYAGLDGMDFLAVTQSNVNTDAATLNREGITATRTQETHSGQAMTVTNYDAVTNKSNLKYHERDYYFPVKGVSWDLTCAWAPAQVAAIEQACSQAVDSIHLK